MVPTNDSPGTGTSSPAPSQEATASPDTEAKDKKKKNEPPPLTMPPKKPQKDGKTWAEIMMEFLDLPSQEQLKWGSDMTKASVAYVQEKTAQRALYNAAKAYIDDPINNRPVEGAPTSQEDLDKLWGPKGSKIEDAVKKNFQREATEGKWRMERAEAKREINQEMKRKMDAIDVDMEMDIKDKKESKKALKEKEAELNRELTPEQRSAQLRAEKAKKAAEDAAREKEAKEEAKDPLGRDHYDPLQMARKQKLNEYISNANVHEATMSVGERVQKINQMTPASDTSNTPNYKIPKTAGTIEDRLAKSKEAAEKRAEERAKREGGKSKWDADHPNKNTSGGSAPGGASGGS